MNQESSKTVDVDQQTGFGLSISGKYGPSVEFTSNLETTSTTAEQDAQQSAVTYARDVVERSKERIVERVRTERTTQILREVEETNQHGFDNSRGEEHIVGIYQFLDKVYETQVFNYGIRQMFDLMIPEPASFNWHLQEGATATIDLPTPPPPLTDDAPDASFLGHGNYLSLAARYGATDIQPPPPMFLVARTTISHGPGDESEEDQPRSATPADLALPAGYAPAWAHAGVIALTDTDEVRTPAFAIAVGEARQLWTATTASKVSVGDNDYFLVASESIFFNLISAPHPQVDAATLPIHAVAFESNNYSIDIKVIFRRESAFLTWQLQTYAKLQEAFTLRMSEYEQRLAVSKAEEATIARDRDEQQNLGPPSLNERVIRTELKKHCIAVLRRTRYEEFDATLATDPPVFDFEEAETEGRIVRFFEHAFEWDQMQYVFYPYFWSRGITWRNRSSYAHADPAFGEFMQAGSARVVVPARPGFEHAVSHYLTTHVIWNGEDALPEIGDPLYKPIVEEIRERTGADDDEIPVGESWETRVPTTLVRVRADASLPTWSRVPQTAWEWAPDPAGDQ